MEDPGFEIHPGILSAGDCSRLGEELSSSRRTRAGARHLMSHPAVRALACREELLKLVRGWLGLTALPYRATLFEKSGSRNWLVVWHQDTTLPLESRFDSPGWGPWSVKEGITYAHAPSWALSRIAALRIHLDDSTPENGPLRVLPGSHCGGVLSDEEVFRLAHQQAAVDCLAARGGVMLMRPLLIHSSSKTSSREPRRVLHLEYATSLDIAPGIRLVQA